MAEIGDFKPVNPLWPTTRIRKPEAHPRPEPPDRRQDRRKREDGTEEKDEHPHIDDYA